MYGRLSSVVTLQTSYAGRPLAAGLDEADKAAARARESLLGEQVERMFGTLVQQPHESVQLFIGIDITVFDDVELAPNDAGRSDVGERFAIAVVGSHRSTCSCDLRGRKCRPITPPARTFNAPVQRRRISALHLISTSAAGLGNAETANAARAGGSTGKNSMYTPFIAV